MIKKINFILLTLLIIFTKTQTAYAGFQSKGDADVLKITMKQVEICTGYQGGDFDDILTEAFCNDAIVIGTGEKEVDIASVDAGASAASYGEPTLLPLGETFTHMRVTIDKKFILKSVGSINAGGNNETDSCITKTVTDDMYGPGVTEATGKYTHRVSVTEDAVGTPQEMSLYWVNGRGETSDGNDYNDGSDPERPAGSTFTQVFGNGGTLSSQTWNSPYNETAADISGLPNTHIAMSIPRFNDGTDDVVLVYKLNSPYTITATPPSIDIAFSTQDGILAQHVSNSEGSETAASLGDGMCAFRIGDVFVKIEMKDAKIERSRGAWR
jgi:hypothetical protein|tara:strand:+ start:73 stop:1050 length:978 start_codon:yes stop_codon:yes gene_type:complete